MKYQYKVIQAYPTKLLYKFETDSPYPLSAGDKIWFPENWKKELGGDSTWRIKSVDHYLVDNFVAILVEKDP